MAIKGIENKSFEEIQMLLNGNNSSDELLEEIEKGAIKKEDIKVSKTEKKVKNTEESITDKPPCLKFLPYMYIIRKRISGSGCDEWLTEPTLK